jgi:hypothetical protein
VISSFPTVSRFVRVVEVLVLLALVSAVTIASGETQTFAQNSDNNNMSDMAGNASSDLTGLLWSFNPVNGSYTNPDQGFQITFPQGWVGTEILVPFGKVVSASPLAAVLNETNMSKFSAMSIVFVDNRNNSALSAISDLSQAADNTTISKNAKYTKVGDCGSLVYAPVTLVGIAGEQVTYFCQSVPMGTGTNISAKTKGITFATEDNSLIFVSFSASPNVYDIDIPRFEEALKTIKIVKPGNIRDSETYIEYKKLLDRNIAK